MVARLHELWLWVFHWPPNVGLCIALLAVAAVVMTTRDQPMRRREKICWIGLAFVLFLGEIYAMQTRQSDDAAARIAEDNRLAEILRQSQQQFEATMKKTGDVLDTTQKVAGLAKDSLNNLTGGGSVAY